MLISVAARHLHAIKHSVTRGAGVLCMLHTADFMQAALATLNPQPSTLNQPLIEVSAAQPQMRWHES